LNLFLSKLQGKHSSEEASPKVFEESFLSSKQFSTSAFKDSFQDGRDHSKSRVRVDK